MFLQFLKVCVSQIALASVISKVVTHQVQDANAEKNSHDLLEEALKDPVHAEEPAIVKFMVYLHAFVPTFKEVDVFQVGCNGNILCIISVKSPFAAHLHASDAGISWSLSANYGQRRRQYVSKRGIG